MSGDPRVLAPLQQAYLAAKHEKVIQRLQFVWDFETRGKIVNSDADADSEIRAWTPPPAEPSIDDLAFGLSIKFAEVTLELEGLKKQHAELIDNITAGFARVERRIRAITHPEPTAPDDPVCAREGCGHVQSEHDGGGCQRISPYCNCHAFHPAPPPAPDLDPVLLKIADLYTSLLPDAPNPNLSLTDLTCLLRDEWRKRTDTNAGEFGTDRAIRAYLKDGGA